MLPKENNRRDEYIILNPEKFNEAALKIPRTKLFHEISESKKRARYTIAKMSMDQCVDFWKRRLGKKRST
jgi:hypothetical protein